VASAGAILPPYAAAQKEADHMPTTARLAWIAAISLLAATLACATLAMGENERFIQGTWTQGTDNGDGHGTYLELRFEAGRFTMQGYPPLEQSGRYRVTGSEGDLLTLELTDQSGDLPTDDREMLLVLDRANDSLMVDGGAPFTRSGQ
jgi:hypothetical protein